MAELDIAPDETVVVSGIGDVYKRQAHGGALAATEVAQVVQFVAHHLERLERGELLPIDRKSVV